MPARRDLRLCGCLRIPLGAGAKVALVAITKTRTFGATTKLDTDSGESKVPFIAYLPGGVSATGPEPGSWGGSGCIAPPKLAVIMPTMAGRARASISCRIVLTIPEEDSFFP